MKKALLSLCLLSGIFSAAAQSFYDMNTIQTIEISFTQTNWDYLLDTATAGYETDLMAEWVKINGIQYDSVGVRYKGNSTYNPSQVKNPFHITLDAFKDQEHEGYTDIKLSNVAKDPSFVREVLSYAILRQYMHAPLSNYANVYVNGTLIGLYANSESVSKSFVDARFNSKTNTFLKCNPPAGAGPGTTSYPNLVYLGTDSTDYYDAYEMKSDYGWADLISLCDTLSNNITAIEKILDVDRALWMLAFNNVMVNLDSYSGAFAQNYYLYEDDHERFNAIIWDLNESFGTFSSTGTGILSSTTAKQQMTHLLHASDANWPLIRKLLSVPMYKRMYIAHMRTILSENFASGSYYTTAQNLQTLISPSVTADVNKFFTVAQFTANLNTDVSSGMTNAPGLTNLMNARNTWLNAQTDFTYTAPSISGVSATNPSPAINTNDTILATVTNASLTGVYLGYRYGQYDPFKRMQMYDDGMHGDGAAGDNLFGAQLPVNASMVQYYIYAENANAGMFSPQRAEYEYYTLFATITMVNPGDVTINELVAINATISTDANGQFADYIELYNNTGNYLSLDNAFLSDSYLTPLQWQFPSNTTIAPYGFLIIWADNDTNQTGLHASFKLSGTGEQLMLSYAAGTVIDSVTFGAQSEDIAYARCTNGTGTFGFQPPSFAAMNCVTGIEEEQAPTANIDVFPNPATDRLTVRSEEAIGTIEIYNTLLQQVYLTTAVSNSSTELDISSLTEGIYYLKAGSQVKKFCVVR